MSSQVYDDEQLSRDEVLIFTRLFSAHLAGSVTKRSDQDDGVVKEYDDGEIIDPAAELDVFRSKTPLTKRQALDRLAEKLRSQFHADQEAKRRATLYALLVQLPPFTLSSDVDQTRLRSNEARRRRFKHLRRFASRFAAQSSSIYAGVRPFFASLRRLLEAQSHDSYGRSLQWLLDDAVLMESGGEEFMRSAVWILKSVLLLSEHEPAESANPFFSTVSANSSSGREFLRIWTMPVLLSNVECASLVRAIPSHVLPLRGRGSQPVHSNDTLRRLARDDEEQLSQTPIPLPTGSLRYAPLTSPSRDSNYAGTWYEWLLAYISSIFPFAG